MLRAFRWHARGAAEAMAAHCQTEGGAHACAASASASAAQRCAFSSHAAAAAAAAASTCARPAIAVAAPVGMLGRATLAHSYLHWTGGAAAAAAARVRRASPPRCSSCGHLPVGVGGTATMRSLHSHAPAHFKGRDQPKTNPTAAQRSTTAAVRGSAAPPAGPNGADASSPPAGHAEGGGSSLVQDLLHKVLQAPKRKSAKAAGKSTASAQDPQQPAPPKSPATLTRAQVDAVRAEAFKQADAEQAARHRSEYPPAKGKAKAAAKSEAAKDKAAPLHSPPKKTTKRVAGAFLHGEHYFRLRDVMVNKSRASGAKILGDEQPAADAAAATAGDSGAAAAAADGTKDGQAQSEAGGARAQRHRRPARASKGASPARNVVSRPPPEWEAGLALLAEQARRVKEVSRAPKAAPLTPEEVVLKLQRQQEREARMAELAAAAAKKAEQAAKRAEQRRLEREEREAAATRKREEAEAARAAHLRSPQGLSDRVHRLSSTTNANVFADQLQQPSEEDRRWFESALVPALAAQPWMLVTLEHERRKLARAVFDFNVNAIREAEAEAARAAEAEAKLALRPPAEQAMIRESRAREDSIRQQHAADIEAWRQRSREERGAPTQPSWPATVTYDRTQSDSLFAGRTLPFPNKLISNALHQHFKPIFMQANTLAKAMATAKTNTEAPDQQSQQADEADVVLRAVATPDELAAEERLPQLFDEFKSKLFALLGYSPLLLPPAPVHFLRHLLVPVYKRRAPPGMPDDYYSLRSFYRLHSAVSQFDSELLQQLYVLLPLPAFRVLVQLLQQAPLPTTLQQNRAAIESYVQELLDTESARLESDAAQTGRTLSQLQQDAQLKLGDSGSVTSPVPRLLPFAPFVDPFPDSPNAAVETCATPMEAAACAKPIWVDGDQERVTTAIQYLLSHALPKPKPAAIPSGSDEPAAAAAAVDADASSAPVTAEPAPLPSSAPVAQTRAMLLYEARIRALLLIFKLLQQPGRIARWATRDSATGSVPITVAKTQDAATTSASSTTSASAVESSAPATATDASPDSAESLPSKLRALPAAVAPVDNPAARHLLLHQLCAELLPSQTRAISLLFHLVKSNSVNGHSLFELLNMGEVRPSKKGGAGGGSVGGKHARRKHSQMAQGLHGDDEAAFDVDDMDPTLEVQVEASDCALEEEAHKFRDDSGVDDSDIDVADALPDGMQEQQEASALMALADDLQSAEGDQAAAGAGRRGPGGKRASPKKLQQDVYAVLERMVVADISSHLNALREAELRAERSEVEALHSTPDADALRSEAQGASPMGHMQRLSDALQDGQSRDTAPTALMATTIVDKGITIRKGGRAERKTDEDAFSGGAADEKELQRRYLAFMRELTRILGPMTPHFLAAVREHYLHISVQELEAVRAQYPESELQPFVAFKVHHDNQAAPPASPYPQAGEAWYAASRRPGEERKGGQLQLPSTTNASAADSTAAAVPASQRSADEMLDDLFPDVSVSLDGEVDGSIDVTANAMNMFAQPLLQLPEYSTPALTLPARTVYLTRTPYQSQWRTSFGSHGSFDFLPPVRLESPSISFCNDVNSVHTHQWLAPYRATAASPVPPCPPSQHKLYVRNLHPEMSAAELLFAFRHIGDIVCGEIHREVLRADLSSQAHHLLESKGSKRSRAARRSKVVSAAGKSPVYAFLYFSSADALQRALSPAMRLFGINAKGYTMYPEAAEEKRVLYMQFSQRAMHQHFHMHHPHLRSPAHSVRGTNAEEHAQQKQIDDAAAVAAAEEANAAASGQSSQAASTAAATSVADGSASSVGATMTRAALGRSFSPSSSSPTLVKEFTMSRIQRDVYALIAASGLNISPYAAVKLTSKLSLYNHGYVHIECSSHQLAEQVFSILHGQRIADQNVVLAWALTKPHAHQQQAAQTNTTRTLTAGTAQLTSTSAQFDNSAHAQVMQFDATKAATAAAAGPSSKSSTDFLLDESRDQESGVRADTI